MRVLKIVHMIWIDSQAMNEWTDVKELNDALKDLHAVGFLIHTDKERYVLSISFDPDTDSANCIQYIPKKCVKKIRVLGSVKVKP